MYLFAVSVSFGLVLWDNSMWCCMLFIHFIAIYYFTSMNTPKSPYAFSFD